MQIDHVLTVDQKRFFVPKGGLVLVTPDMACSTISQHFGIAGHHDCIDSAIIFIIHIQTEARSAALATEAPCRLHT